MRSGLRLPETSWRNGWRIEVDREFVRIIGVERVLAVLPNGYCVAYKHDDRPVDVWMPPVLAQIAGSWRRHRWDIHRWLMLCGFRDDPPGNNGMYRTMRWRWDFWNGNRSIFARRYVEKYGWDAYKKRYP